MVGLAAVVLAGLVAIPGGRAEEDDAPHPLHVAAAAGDLSRVTPVYETLPGWQTATDGIREAASLPAHRWKK